MGTSFRNCEFRIIITFKKEVKQVISNDLEHYSYVLNKNYIEELNNLPLIDNGFIYKNYCMGSGSERQYFSDENGKKIDTIRTKIMDSNKLIKEISGDILYLDPPYNQRQYASNYHMLNTITKYDNFVPKGKTGLREYNRSDYCKKGEVHSSFEDLIKNAQFKHIFLSYNNEGLMSKSDVEKIMKKYGEYSLVTKEYQRFKADKTENRNHKADKTYEYLHILTKANI